MLQTPDQRWPVSKKREREEWSKVPQTPDQRWSVRYEKERRRRRQLWRKTEIQTRVPLIRGGTVSVAVRAI